MEGTVERKRPAPCCEDCEMLHLTSRGRELLRVKATVTLRCSTCVKECWEWRPAALGRRVMLGMLVAVAGVGASVMARWMCCVRQSSASSEKYWLVVMLVNCSATSLRAGEQLEDNKEVGSDTGQ